VLQISETAVMLYPQRSLLVVYSVRTACTFLPWVLLFDYIYSRPTDRRDDFFHIETRLVLFQTYLQRLRATMHYINIMVSGVFTPGTIHRGLFVQHFRTWAHEWSHVYESSQV